MSLRLDSRAIDRYADRALHRQLADRIREAILGGELRAGEALPSEGDLMGMVGLSRTAVREALDVLAGEGRIVKRSGVVARVATPPKVVHMATSRYQEELDLLAELAETGKPHPATSAFTVDHGVEWEGYQVRAVYEEDTARDEDAARLGVRVGAAVLRRYLVKSVGGRPVQLQDSVIPLELVKGTPVADPANQPWPGGTLAELLSVGVVVSHVSEQATVEDAPTAVERRLLELETAGPVWHIVRTFWAGHGGQRRPVECSTVVCPARGTVLAYETALTYRGTERS
jgi:GntR family transcriptional regulator